MITFTFDTVHSVADTISLFKEFEHRTLTRNGVFNDVI